MTGEATQQSSAFSSIGRYLLEPKLDQDEKPQTFRDQNQVGSKSCGLLVLPRPWTPPFFVVSTDLYVDWIQQEKPSELLKEVGQEIVALCVTWQTTWQKGLILRSSAVAETMRDRGAYDSFELPADFNAETIGKAINQIYEAFDCAGSDDSMAIIVQALARCVIKGHVSNELRVSKTINQWMWEIESSGASNGRFNSQRSRIPDIQTPLKLRSNSKKDLSNILKSVCRWVTIQHGPRRSHIEWGSLGEQIWIFQIDFEDDLPDYGSDPNALLRKVDDRPSGTPAKGSPWKRADSESDTGWSKIDKIKIFIENRSHPYPSLYYLTAFDFHQAIGRGYDLKADIDSITHGRAVCRTDCKSSNIDRLNLPRTDSVSPDVALQFIIETTAALKQKGALETEICFILHKFIPARAAAWALARPDQQIVLIDTLWGLPDGLQYLPHDTFEVDIRRQEISSEYIKYKPQFLQETESGEWALKQVARNLTRSRSLGVHHLREISLETHRIAKGLGRPTQIMWFCDVAEAANVGKNVPWFSMDPEQPRQKVQSSLAPTLTKIIIRNFDDLETVEKFDHEKVVLILEPEAGLYRNDEFLKRIIEVAAKPAFPVLMTGSVLGHAYYKLERGGVSVRTDSPSYSRVRQKQTFRKLVRDEIPSRIIDHGERVAQAKIDKTESRCALVIKLFEESQELLNARSPDEVIAELADLTEILRSLCAATGVDWDNVQAVAEQKRSARGSFEQNIVLMETSWPKWSDQDTLPESHIIPLSALGYIITNGKEHIINFSAAVAKGASNIVLLTNGTRIQVSITMDGIRITECNDEPTVGTQLKFDF